MYVFFKKLLIVKKVAIKYYSRGFGSLQQVLWASVKVGDVILSSLAQTACSTISLDGTYNVYKIKETIVLY